jgi:hypothetical protein
MMDDEIRQHLRDEEYVKFDPQTGDPEENDEVEIDDGIFSFEDSESDGEFEKLESLLKQRRADEAFDSEEVLNRLISDARELLGNPTGEEAMQALEEAGG